MYDGASPRERYRLRGCAEPPTARGGRTGAGNLIWRPRSAEEPCLWGNMPLGKLVAIILLARALGVTHLVESGRAGGLALVHYARLGGFIHGLTSVELYPIDGVREELRRTMPTTLTLADGNGLVLVPEAVENVTRRVGPAARVAVLLDGPKGARALELARRLAPHVVFVAVDDQHVPPDEWPQRLSTHVAHALWRAAFPLARDYALSAQTPADKTYFPPNDDLTFLFGARWRPPRAAAR